MPTLTGPVQAAALPTAAANDDDATRSTLRFITCGSVDDGKSTLIGRLLHAAGGIAADQLDTLRTESARFGTTGDGVDYALLLDGLEAEREQGITIDVAYRYFSTPRRAFVAADTPGHAQYTRNMATGASNAEVAILLVDASKGLLEQTRRHAAIVALLGLRHVVLAVNKMDLVGFDRGRFNAIVAAFDTAAQTLGFAAVHAVPLVARDGDNIISLSPRMPWYGGPTLLTLLETINAGSSASGAPLRFPVQWVNRPDPSFRGLAGTVASGQLSVGQDVVSSRSGQRSRVGRLVTYDDDLDVAAAGRAVTVVLETDLDIGRGDVLCAPRSRPSVTRRLSADLIWFGDTPGDRAGRYLLKTGHAVVPATLSDVRDRLDLARLERAPATRLVANDIGRVEIDTAEPVAVDPYASNRETGAFILIDRTTHLTVAAGLVLEAVDSARDTHPHAFDLTPSARAAIKGHDPLVVWLTGLPGSGKSTIANLVEQRLAGVGIHTALLDGDALRQGLNRDLGFTLSDRAENVRRTGEVARLFHDAGLVVLVALVSPMRADRAAVADRLPEGRFVEVHVQASPAACRARDPKGLWGKADAGTLTQFTGRDQAYEAPERPALRLDTENVTAEAAAATLADLILSRLRPAGDPMDCASL